MVSSITNLLRAKNKLAKYFFTLAGYCAAFAIITPVIITDTSNIAIWTITDLFFIGDLGGRVDVTLLLGMTFISLFSAGVVLENNNKTVKEVGLISAVLPIPALISTFMSFSNAESLPPYGEPAIVEASFGFGMILLIFSILFSILGGFSVRPGGIIVDKLATRKKVIHFENIESKINRSL
ncbi:MAG: hypothetical protein IH840_00795 [Candidatus Heimdallarchaeota archaeon]|nr:hypothetical protein [Candidatus Heimdallarchaeota archaeon]